MTCSVQSLYELYHLASSAVSLSRYSLTLEDRDIWRTTTDRSKEIAILVVGKVEFLLRQELARLQHMFVTQGAVNHGRETGMIPSPGEINIAFDLLHIATCVAAEFGALRCFRTIGTLCDDYVEQLPGIQTLRPLTLKAVSDLSKTNITQKILNRR